MKHKIANFFAFIILILSIYSSISFFYYFHNHFLKLESSSPLLLPGKFLFLSFSFPGLYLPFYSIMITNFFLSGELNLKKFGVLSMWLLPFMIASIMLNVIFLKNNVLTNLMVDKLGYFNSILISSLLTFMSTIFASVASWIDFDKMEHEKTEEEKANEHKSKRDNERREIAFGTKEKVRIDEKKKILRESLALAQRESEILNAQRENELLNVQMENEILKTQREKEKEFSIFFARSSAGELSTSENVLQLTEFETKIEEENEFEDELFEDNEEVIKIEMQHSPDTGETGHFLDGFKKNVYIKILNEEEEIKEEEEETKQFNVSKIYEQAISKIEIKEEDFEPKEIERLQLEAMKNSKKIEEFYEKLKVKTVFVGPVFTIFKIASKEPLNAIQINEIFLEIQETIDDASCNLYSIKSSENEIILEVENKKKKFESLSSILLKTKFMQDKHRLIFGTDSLGDPISFEFETIKNMLIIGGKKTGKTSFILNAILSSIFLNGPSELKIGILDLNGTQNFLKFNGFAHMINNVASDKDEISKLINWTLKKIKERRNLFKKTNCKNITEYEEKRNKKIPLVVIFIDGINFIIKDKDLGKEIAKIITLGMDYKVHIFATLDHNFEENFVHKIYFDTKLVFKCPKNFAKEYILSRNTEVLLNRGDAFLKYQNETKRVITPTLQDFENTVKIIKEEYDSEVSK